MTDPDGKENEFERWTFSTVVAQYQYDGRNFRTVKRTYANNQLSEIRHFYYNSGWQCLEERLEAGGTIASAADRQNVWGLRYTDDLVLRDRNADGVSGTGSLGIVSDSGDTVGNLPHYAVNVEASIS